MHHTVCDIVPDMAAEFRMLRYGGPHSPFSVYIRMGWLSLSAALTVCHHYPYGLETSALAFVGLAWAPHVPEAC